MENTVIWRELAILLTVAVAGVFGQNATPVKADDLAPPLVWDKILQTGEPAGPGPENFLGRVTVLCFFPQVFQNAPLIGQWNELVGKFQDQSVNFVWIASETEPALGAWLRDHPVRGSLLMDSGAKTASAYGVEAGGSVIIGANGRIAGFDPGMPRESEVKAVLEGGKVHLDTEPFRFPPAEAKPDVPPSYTVHITPSKSEGTSSMDGADYWVRRGFDLRSVFAAVYEKDKSRVLLPAPLDKDDRYDFVLVMPREEEREAVLRLVRQAIEKQFQVSVTTESRPADVYVMTAIPGKTPREQKGEASFGGAGMSWNSAEIELTLPAGTLPSAEALQKAAADLMKDKASAGISALAAPSSRMDEFRIMLEDVLNRPIVDETNLHGTYDFSFEGAKSTADLLQLMRDRLGLALTPELKNIDMLVVAPLAR
jgi:uncharacterized protein (TIGR03435 family)